MTGFGSGSSGSGSGSGGAPNHSVSGSWMGQYFYFGRNDGGSFEAVFIEIGPHLEGSILDDGQLGEAIVNGTFSYPDLRFSKKYFKSNLDPVEYVGTMNADGNVISGTWWILPTAAGGGAGLGTWIARRADSGTELEDDERFVLKDEEIERVFQPSHN
mgnify:CR=1 FL=1